MDAEDALTSAMKCVHCPCWIGIASACSTPRPPCEASAGKQLEVAQAALDRAATRLRIAHGSIDNSRAVRDGSVAISITFISGVSKIVA